MQKEQLLLIPGPTPVHPRILNALSLPTISHVSPVLVDELKEALDNLKRIVFCQEGQPFIVAGSGTLAMEMAMLNTVKRGENILVLSQGFFGDRIREIAESFDLVCDVIQSPWGSAVLHEDLAREIAKKDYAAVFSTHVDTATGACAPVEEYAEVLKDFDGLYIVDGVCATGGIEERMDDWGIDVVLTAAQKCFGVPPGLSVLILSRRAMDTRQSMGAISAYYADLLRWLPIMKDPSGYFSTPCVNEIRAFNEGTKIVLEEGMEERFRRHQRVAEAIRAALTQLGFTFFTDEKFFADTLSVCYYPEGVEDKAFRTAYASNGVIVAGGLGEVAGKVFRMGHMGNLSVSQVQFAVAALESTLSDLGHSFTPHAGIQAAREILEFSSI